MSDSFPTIPKQLATLREALGNDHTPVKRPTPKAGKVITVRVQQCSLWAVNTRDVSLIDAARNDALRASMKENGQQIPVIGRRIGTSTKIEVIAGARRLAVLQDFARDNPDVMIMVDLREMDDAEACALVAAENEGRQAFVPLETAHFYKQALTTGIYKDQAALANALCLNKSTVGRTLTILELPSEVIDKVVDLRAISARQASTFMTYWNDETSQPAMEACLASLKPTNSARTFKAVFDAVKPPTSDNDLQTFDGVTVGTLRATKAGLKIELSNAADAVELEDVVALIRQRMLQLRTQD